MPQIPQNKRRAKKQKNSFRHTDAVEPDFVSRGDGQDYALVTRNCGGMIRELRLATEGKSVMGHIRGNISGRKSGKGGAPKKVWINKNDVVLVCLRDFDEKTVDIVHRYPPEHVYRLRGAGQLSNFKDVDFDAAYGDSESDNDTGIVFGIVDDEKWSDSRVRDRSASPFDVDCI